jgi:hypothetical protein
MYIYTWYVFNFVGYLYLRLYLYSYLYVYNVYSYIYSIIQKMVLFETIWVEHWNLNGDVEFQQHVCNY